MLSSRLPTLAFISILIHMSTAAPVSNSSTAAILQNAIICFPSFIVPYAPVPDDCTKAVRIFKTDPDYTKTIPYARPSKAAEASAREVPVFWSWGSCVIDLDAAPNADPATFSLESIGPVVDELRDQCVAGKEGVSKYGGSGTIDNAKNFFITIRDARAPDPPRFVDGLATESDGIPVT